MTTTQFMPGGTIHLHRHDLPEGFVAGPVVAVDTETMGLQPHRDRLCLVQLSAGDGVCHAVQFERGAYAAPNLKRLLADPKVLKLFHFGRFDMATLCNAFGVMPAPVYCTKIASKPARSSRTRSGRYPKAARASPSRPSRASIASSFSRRACRKSTSEAA